MTLEADRLRRAAATFEVLLDPVAAVRVFPRWTGPAAERFDAELRGWRVLLDGLAAEARAAAGRVSPSSGGPG
jgi:hypothetical protein